MRAASAEALRAAEIARLSHKAACARGAAAVDAAAGGAPGAPAAAAPEQAAEPAAEVVEEPMEDSDRRAAQAQLAQLAAAAASLRGIPSQAETVSKLEAEQQAIRQRLHRARPLAQRQKALQGAVERRRAAILLLEVKEHESL